MRAVLVGVGNFGSSWYKRLQRHPDISALIVVEPNDELQKNLDPETPSYATLEEALSADRPDFVINVTPPHVHTTINEIAFSHGLPVLCEKPISHDLADATYIAGQAELKGIPFMISENYRYFAPVLKAKELLDSGVIGRLSSVHIEFSRFHVAAGSYFERLENALLEDVAIHHFDMIRYFTGQEAKAVFARNSNPPGSWSASTIHLTAWMELESGTIVSYCGSMMAKGKLTEWYGDWRFEGTEGVITLSSGHAVRLIKEGQKDVVHTYDGVGEYGTIDEFIAALREQREPRPSGNDYLKSQRLVFAAADSSRTGKLVSVIMS